MLILQVINEYFKYLYYKLAIFQYEDVPGIYFAVKKGRKFHAVEKP